MVNTASDILLDSYSLELNDVIAEREQAQDLPQQVKDHRAAVFAIIEKHLKGMSNGGCAKLCSCGGATM